MTLNRTIDDLRDENALLRKENERLKQKDSEAAGTLRANVAEVQLTEALERMTAAEHKLLDYEGKEMLYSGRTELAAFKKREPLVQEVIRLSNAYVAALKAGSYGAEAENNLYEATRKLAEWKP